MGSRAAHLLEPELSLTSFEEEARMPRGANALAVARMAITAITTYCIVEAFDRPLLPSRADKGAL